MGDRIRVRADKRDAHVNKYQLQEVSNQVEKIVENVENIF